MLLGFEDAIAEQDANDSVTLEAEAAAMEAGGGRKNGGKAGNVQGIGSDGSGAVLTSTSNDLGGFGGSEGEEVDGRATSQVCSVEDVFISLSEPKSASYDISYPSRSTDLTIGR